MEEEEGKGGRGTRDEVMIWSGRECLNFMGELWRRCRRREQSRAGKGEGRQDEGYREREWGKWRNGKRQGGRGKRAAMIYNVDRTGIRGGGGFRVCGCKNGNTVVCWIF